MEIKIVQKKNLKEIYKLAELMCRNEILQLHMEIPINFKDLKDSIQDLIEKKNGLVYLEDDEVMGFLLYEKWEYPNGNYVVVPFWGYGAKGKNRDKIMSKLFQHMAESETDTKIETHFNVKLYAHDEEMIRLFSFLQFGIQCEEGLRLTSAVVKMKKNNSKDEDIHELTKSEIDDRWGQIWPVISMLVNHLKKSPVFYEGSEFTEEVYHDFVMDKGTRLFVMEIEGKVSGITLVNEDGNSFLTSGVDIRNVGEMYICDEYRGTGMAQHLLSYVIEKLKEERVNLVWVEHGTANPNARGFWNKYFKTYAYSMIRDIKKVVD